jgi:Uma2 family endonuclease
MTRAQTLLTPADEGLPLSRAEFAEADVRRPWRYERAQGRLVVMVPTGHDHHAAAEPIRDALVVYKVTHPSVVEHVFEETWTAIDDDTDREPDLGVYLRGTPGRIPDRIPELIFEIVSADRRDRTRDYVEKRAEYERIGVREYVLVDRFERRCTVLRRTGDAFAESVLGPDDAYETPLLPGLRIPLGEVLPAQNP